MIPFCPKNVIQFLEMPNYGGHVGFMSSFKPKENTWLEKRIIRFIKENIQIPIL
jgi:uncharacterized protein